MKINGKIGYSAMDSDFYEMEAYLSDKELYVIVQNCDTEWCYSVSHQSVEVYDRDTVESFEEMPVDSEYADIFRMLKGMIDVMKFAKIAQK